MKTTISNLTKKQRISLYALLYIPAMLITFVIPFGPFTIIPWTMFCISGFNLGRLISNNY